VRGLGNAHITAFYDRDGLSFRNCVDANLVYAVRLLGSVVCGSCIFSVIPNGRLSSLDMF
jgi:hypothetical protein